MTSDDIEPATKGSDVVKTEVLVLKWTEVESLVDPEFE